MSILDERLSMREKYLEQRMEDQKNALMDQFVLLNEKLNIIMDFLRDSQFSDRILDHKVHTSNILSFIHYVTYFRWLESANHDSHMPVAFLLPSHIAIANVSRKSHCDL